MAGYNLEEIRNRLNIVDLIGRYMTLKPAGKNYKGRCPFHPDKNPSLTVSPEKGLWYCFGCQAGGDAIGFLMRIEKIPFEEAVERLASELGLDRSGRGTGKAKLYQVCAEAAEFFAQELYGPRGQKARAYLQGRQLMPAVWKKYGLGYAPDSWDALLKKLSRWGVDVLHQLGLVVQGKQGYYDLFRDRVMFPIRDAQGRPVAFAGRSLNGEPKYLNGPNTPLFTKGTLLYGLDLAKEAMKAKGRAVLVEGYTDVISFQTAGIEEAVGSMGTSLTEEQARLLARYTDQVVIAYDRDAAGEASALRGLLILAKAHLKVQVALLPPGEDPDSLVRREGAEAAAAVLQNPRPFHHFLVEAVVARYDTRTVEGKDQALQEVQSLWSEVGSAALKHELARGLAEHLSLREEEVLRILEKKERLVPVPPSSDRLSPEDLFVRFLLEQKIPADHLADLDLEAFRPEYRPIVARWWEGWKGGRPPTWTELGGQLEPQQAAALARLTLLDLEFSNEEKAVADAVQRFLVLPRLTRRLEELRRQVKEAERAGRKEDVLRLNAELQRICRERARLAHRR